MDVRTPRASDSNRVEIDRGHHPGAVSQKKTIVLRAAVRGVWLRPVINTAHVGDQTGVVWNVLWERQ
jgi:hypothetical protein